MMSVYDLIRELSYYPADMEVRIKVSNSSLCLDPCGTSYEFKPPIKTDHNRVIIEADP